MKSIVKSHLPPSVVPLARSLLYWLQSVPYLGNQVTCPCCGGHFRHFLPHAYEVIARLNALCPRCHCAERHRLLWLYLHNRTNFFRDNLKVLHFAPEYIFERKIRKCSNLDYITADLLSPDVMVHMDITDIPYTDNTFDVILCSHVLVYVQDDRKAMCELYRVLKPGGWAILLVPIDLELATTIEDPSAIDPLERLRRFGQRDHVRIYGRDYLTRLEQAGFTVRQDPYVQELPPSLIERYSLLDVPIFFCTKQV
jgi:hypothetical protein